jgi:hypothetical protein
VCSATLSSFICDKEKKIEIHVQLAFVVRNEKYIDVIVRKKETG